MSANTKTNDAATEGPEFETWDPAADADNVDTFDATGGEVAVRDGGVKDEIRELMTGAPAMYSSIKGTSFEARKTTLAAVKNSAPIAENLGKTINVVNIIVQAVVMKNERTGELENVPRTILIDDEGVAYHAISKVLFSDVKDIIGLVKEPHTWPEPLPIVIERRKAATGHFFTMSIA